MVAPLATHPPVCLCPPQVFEEGALGRAPPSSSTGTGGSSSEGSNLSTYKELCSLATDLGQPDLIYKFMDLAHHNQVR